MKINRRPLLHALFLCSVMASWEALARTGVINVFYTGSPSGIASALLQLFTHGSLGSHALKSIKNLLAGYALGVICGAGLGIVVGYYKRLYDNLKTYAQLLYIIPQLVLIPFFIIWLGIDDLAKTAIVFVMSFFPVFIAAMEAAKNADRELDDVCRIYGAGRLFTLVYFVLPASSGPIFSGAKISVGRAAAGMILGETFGRAEGLGYLLFHFGSLYSVNNMMAALLLLTAVSISLYCGINLAEKKLIRWRN